MKRPRRIVRYKNLKNLFAKLYGCKPGEVDGWGIVTQDNQSLNFDKLKETIHRQGIWGFNDNGIVRFWVAPDCDYYLIARFFAHEAGHLNGRQYKDLMKEELKAKEYEDVAFYALKKAAKVISKILVERNGLSV